ncbi:MAG: hypothetical protein ACK4HF_11620 [Paracoccaceae bacterium]
MSEPMSTLEIEDVLSSIRRLVSEDLRPAPRPPETPARAADKLLLTPSLRVVEEVAGPWPESAAPSVTAATGATSAPVEDVVSRLGAAVIEDEWESPFGDPEIWSGATTPAGAVAGFVPSARSRPGGDQVAGFDDMPTGFVDPPMAAFAEVDDVLAEPPGAAGARVRAPLRQVTPPQSAGDDSEWADEAEAAVRADLAQETEEEVISGLYDAQAGGMAFDEEVLRDLVRDLIREELSGTLGERITRNVRKLVRAEIARAMALREFE